MKIEFLVNFIVQQKARICIYAFLVIAIVFAFSTALAVKTKSEQIDNQEQKQYEKDRKLDKTISLYRVLRTKKKNTQDMGVDISSLDDRLENLKGLIYIKKDNFAAVQLIGVLNNKLDQLIAIKQEENRKAEIAKNDLAAQKEIETAQGTIKGTVSSGKNSLSDVSIALKSGNKVITSSKTNQSGNYTIKASEGKYLIVASKVGYNSLYRYNTVITKGQDSTINLTLTPLIAKKATNKTASASKPSSNTSVGNNSGSTPTTPTPAPTPAPTPTPKPTPDPPPNKSDLSVPNVEAAINAQRRLYGLYELKVNPLFEKAAANKTRDMLENDYFAHCSPYDDHKCDIDFAKELGYTGWFGCNLAVGPYIYWVETLIDLWMTSPGHRAFILNNYTHEMGVGVYAGRWAYCAG